VHPPTEVRHVFLVTEVENVAIHRIIDAVTVFGNISVRVNFGIGGELTIPGVLVNSESKGKYTKL
jgi:hypothetical protein